GGDLDRRGEPLVNGLRGASSRFAFERAQSLVRTGALEPSLVDSGSRAGALGVGDLDVSANHAREEPKRFVYFHVLYLSVVARLRRSGVRTASLQCQETCRRCPPYLAGNPLGLVVRFTP